MDESIHLAAVLQAIGFRHVIATLWSIYDSTSPDIYTALRDAGRPGAGDAALALHKALLAARRDHPARVTVWAPYVHIGP